MRISESRTPRLFFLQEARLKTGKVKGRISAGVQKRFPALIF